MPSSAASVDSSLRDYNTWRHEISRKNLENARQQAQQARKYDSAKTRRTMATELARRTGMNAREWQLDVAEAFHLGLDCTVIAGTGAGKTIPMLLPCFLPENKEKTCIALSPLKALQRDQTQRFRRAGVSALAVNGDTWTSAVGKDIKSHKFRTTFTSPEMLLKHREAREVLSTIGLSGHVSGLFVDEGHCISQWGGDFRPTYAELGKVRALLSSGAPVVCMSATMTRKDLVEAEESLLIIPEKAFYVNLGNDRPNIMQRVIKMDSSDDFGALDKLLDLQNAELPSDIPKTLVFANTRNTTQRVWRHLHKQLSPLLQDSIDYLYALRNRRSRQRVMEDFTKGKIKILIATEAAGMGADIPDIEHVIQFGAPSSLSVWIQRAGRAGRAPHIMALATLLIEKSVFKKVNRRRARKKRKTVTAHGVSAEAISEPVIEYQKSVHPSLRGYLESTACRREVVDKHFSNPPRTENPPSHRCCDRCAAETSAATRAGTSILTSADLLADSEESSDSDLDLDLDLDLQHLPSPPSRSVAPPATATSRKRTRIGPQALHPSSASNMPIHRATNQEDTNPEETAMGTVWPLVRVKDFRARADKALRDWRTNIMATRYADSFFSAEAILSDDQIATLAYDARLKTVQDIEQRIRDPPWVFARRHGQELLDILHQLDVEHVRSKGKARARRVADENRPPSPIDVESEDDPMDTMEPEDEGGPPPLVNVPLSPTTVPAPPPKPRPKPRPVHRQGVSARQPNVHEFNASVPYPPHVSGTEGLHPQSLARVTITHIPAAGTTFEWPLH